MSRDFSLVWSQGVEWVREVGGCGVGSSQPSTFLDYGEGEVGPWSQRWVPILMAASVLFWEENQGVPNDSVSAKNGFVVCVF